MCEETAKRYLERVCNGEQIGDPVVVAKAQAYSLGVPATVATDTEVYLQMTIREILEDEWSLPLDVPLYRLPETYNVTGVELLKILSDLLEKLSKWNRKEELEDVSRT